MKGFDMPYRLKHCRPRAWAIALCFSVMFCLAVRTDLAQAAAAPMSSEEYIDSMVSKAGRRPTYNEFNSYLSQSGIAVASDAAKKAWKAWAGSQKPVISASDLAELLQAKRDSVISLQIHEVVRHETASPSGNWENECEFAMSANRLLLTSKRGKTLASPEVSYVQAYDGQKIRTYQNFPDTTPFGTVERFQGRRVFFNVDGTLGASMLLDTNADLGRTWFAHDIVACMKSPLALVCEETKEVEGHKCIVVALGAPPVIRVYLDPERGYAVTRYEQRARMENGAVTFEPPSSAWQNSDFEDHGNGIWLPKKVVHEWWEKGKVVATRTTSVLSCKVNKELDDKMFTDIFPEGAKINDTIIKLQYDLKPGTSIEKVIADALAATGTGANASDPSITQNGKALPQPSGAQEAVATVDRLSGSPGIAGVWYWVSGGVVVLAGLVAASAYLRRRKPRDA